MAQKHNFFALLADEESDDITQLISRVKEEKMNKNSSMEQVQKEKNEEKKMAHQNIPTDHMQAKRFPRNNVQRSFGDDSNTGERRMMAKNVKINNSIASEDSQGWHTATRNNNYQRNNGGSNVYQRGNGYNNYGGSNYRRGNGNYQLNNSVQYQKINGRNDLAGEESVEIKSEGLKPVTPEGQEEAQSEKKSTEGQESDAQSEAATSEKKKSKKKNKKKNKKEDIIEEKDKQKEEERRNYVTFKEYEEKRLEDRKSLGEALKRSEERKVEVKDFESMKHIGKRIVTAEDIQKDNIKDVNAHKKKDDTKDEKPKTISIDEFIKPDGGRSLYFQRRLNDFRDAERKKKELRDAEKSNGKSNDDVRPNGNVYSENKPSGRPKGKSVAQERPNGRSYGERPNGRRHGNGERLADDGPAPAARPPPPAPSFEFEVQQFPALTRPNGNA